ncbi:MAG TPA: N-acetylmuramoyl-L-alanine amidase, partial [Ktedonobacteraceae bacterium]|nr:N-acetylmuramoyl-L-alanine amidase [Ktedonobacteraceae bacterium]
MRKRILFKYVAFPVFFLVLILGLVFRFWGEILPSQAASSADFNDQAFTQVANEFQVPASLLKAICYMEGRLSMHNGSPSIDHGYGCMHLLKNDRADTLDSAAKDLGVSATQLQHDIVTNIRGGAD